MCKLLDIEKSRTTPWQPQTNGFLERSHSTLKAYLRSFVNKANDWNRLLTYAMFAIIQQCIRQRRIRRTS